MANAAEKTGSFFADPFGGGAAFTQTFMGGPIAPSYLGGSEEEEARQRAMLTGYGQAAMGSGSLGYDQGLGTMGAAAGQTQVDRAAAGNYASQGSQLGQAGVGGQNAAIANARGMAGQSTDSLARLQLQQQSAANQRQMMAMAANTRGGNQAASMRNAQGAGAQMQMQTNQAAAQLRAAEQQAALNRQLNVEQMAAGVGGQQAGLGYGMYGQGIGMQQASTGQLAGIGNQQAQAGLGQQGVGLGALEILSDRDKAKLDAERANVSANQANKNPGSAFGGIIGSIFGA
jgi:hypothetical protein